MQYTHENQLEDTTLISFKDSVLPSSIANARAKVSTWLFTSLLSSGLIHMIGEISTITATNFQKVL